MLRPEFLRAWPEPLCSDCFTNFQRLDENAGKNNSDLLKASRFLQTTLVAQFAAKLQKRSGRMGPKSMLSTDSRDPEEFASRFQENKAAFTRSFAQIHKKVRRYWSLLCE